MFSENLFNDKCENDTRALIANLILN